MNKRTMGVMIIVVVLSLTVLGLQSYKAGGQVRGDSREDNIQLMMECYKDAYQVYLRLSRSEQELSRKTARSVDIHNTAVLLFYLRTGMTPIVEQ